MKTLRWGVLGAARIALNKVIPGMQRTDSAHVVAIGSRNHEKAGNAAAHLGIDRAYGSYDAVLADSDVEAVYIPLPNHLHVPWAIRAAEAGKHVLCEKPIALSAGEARQLIEVRNRTGLQIIEAFMVRCHPQWVAARDLLRSGRIGELRSMTCTFSYYKTDPDDIRHHREWGGGALMDIGCYPIMAARWLFDREPARVLGCIERDPDLDVDRLTSAVMDFGNAQASFTVGTQMIAHQRVQLFGSGRIEIEIPFNAPPDAACRIFVDNTGSPDGAGIEVMEFDAVDQYMLQAEAFARAVAGDEPPVMTLEDSVANMATIDAVFRSAESGDWERLG